MSKDWNYYLDEITDADVEFEDITRIINSMEKDGIDPFDSEKVMTDLCSLRYRFGFFFMSYQAIYFLTRPKECIHQGFRDVSRALKVLKSLRAIMREVSDEFEDEETCGGNHKPLKETDDQSAQEEDGTQEDREEGDSQEE
jgi:hypothetical protein